MKNNELYTIGATTKLIMQAVEKRDIEIIQRIRDISKKWESGLKNIGLDLEMEVKQLQLCGMDIKVDKSLKHNEIEFK